MSVSVLVRDEVLGSDGVTFTLEFPAERLSVREIIRERVYQEVEDHNRGAVLAAGRKRLVEPAPEEVALNGSKPPRVRQINWKDQFAKACEAFERRRVLVLVGDRQTTSLDEVVTLTRGVEVTFVRLVMLVGG